MVGLSRLAVFGRVMGSWPRSFFIFGGQVPVSAADFDFFRRVESAATGFTRERNRVELIGVSNRGF